MAQRAPGSPGEAPGAADPMGSRDVAKNTNALAENQHLAERIEAEHQAARAAARTAIEHAIECGRLLIEAKAAQPHGQWLPWLEAHTSVSARQSQRYMRLATAAIEGKCDATSFLTIEGALAAITAPRDEPEPEAPAVPLDEYLAKPRPLEPGEIEIPVADVLFRRKLYPRTSVRPDLIERYAEFLVDLPPIEVNQRHELIDGLHRLEAHKKAGAETIRAVVTQVADDIEHLKLACKRNSRHGEQLPIEEERRARQECKGPAQTYQRLPASLAEFILLRIKEIDPRIRLHRTGLELPDDLSFEQWMAIGDVLPRPPEGAFRR
jgi:hypothetical protein